MAKKKKSPKTTPVVPVENVPNTVREEVLDTDRVIKPEGGDARVVVVEEGNYRKK